MWKDPESQLELVDILTPLLRVTAFDTAKTPNEHDTAGVNGPFTLRDPTTGTETPFRPPNGGEMGLWETLVAKSLGPHPHGTPHGSPLVASVSLWWLLTGELPEATKAQTPERDAPQDRKDRRIPVALVSGAEAIDRLCPSLTPSMTRTSELVSWQFPILSMVRQNRHKLLGI